MMKTMRTSNSTRGENALLASDFDGGQLDGIIIELKPVDLGEDGGSDEQRPRL